jgi:hypothetical protein
VYVAILENVVPDGNETAPLSGAVKFPQSETSRNSTPASDLLTQLLYVLKIINNSELVI